MSTKLNHCSNLFPFWQDTPTHQASEFDMDKVKTTLKQFVRDWSLEGQAERDTCYKPVIEEIQARFKDE